MGDTPLHNAVENEKREFAQRLIDLNANISLRNNDGKCVQWPMPDEEKDDTETKDDDTKVEDEDEEKKEEQK